MNDVTRRHILGAGMVVAGTMAMPAILQAQTGSYQAWNPDPVDRLGRILRARYGKHRQEGC